MNSSQFSCWLDKWLVLPPHHIHHSYEKQNLSSDITRTYLYNALSMHKNLCMCRQIKQDMHFLLYNSNNNNNNNNYA